jgi:replicative DNA helicase
LSEQQMWSNEAERAVIGCLLLEPETLNGLEGLTAADFYAERHRIIYETISEMSQKGIGIDPLTVRAAMGDKADDIGGLQYLTQCLNTVYSASQAHEYARIVRDKRVRRDMQRIAGLLSVAARAETSVDESISAAQSALMQLAVSRDDAGFEHMGTLMLEHLEELYQSRNKPGRAIMTGIKPLDATLGGIHPSEVVIIAGRPSSGKSAMAIQIGYEAAKQERHVGIISLEMSPGQIVERRVCALAGVDGQKLRLRMVTEREWDTIFRVATEIAPLPIYIERSATITVSQLQSRARRMRIKHGLDLLIIDYLQLMSSDARHANRQEEISEISRSLKQLAMSLDIPVIALSQMSRDVEKRENKRPQLSDLRESGSLEQDANTVIFLHYPNGVKRNQPSECEVLVAKQRNGPVGMCPMMFLPQKTMFVPMEGRPEQREDF